MITLLTWLCLLILCMHQGFVTARVICMNKEVTDRQFKLNCTIDKFTSDITIRYPSNDLGFAYCIVPVSSETHCSCSCNSTITCNCSISLDLSTRTATLQIFDNDLSSLFGCYACEHGSYKKSMMISRSPTKDCADGKKHDETLSIVGLVLPLFFAVAAVVSLILVCWFPYLPGRIFNRISRCIDRKKEPGYGPLKNDIICATCDSILTCALCTNCKDYYFCDACCVHHQEMNSDHIMFQTQQIVVNPKKVNCESRNCTKLAERFCTYCWKPFCSLCSKNDHCKKREIIVIYQSHADCKRQKPVDVQEKLTLLYNALFQDDTYPVRVCGIAYVADESIVVIDGNNLKLIVFKSQERTSCMIENLEYEPNAITTMTGNEFAVTYPHEKYIQIYHLTLNTMQSTSTYRVSEGKKIRTNRKPYNIAYNQSRFAVEVGDREDGRIVIIDIETENISNPIKCSYAFFTGHTIRLALDQNRLFVSAMGKKMVSCMDVDGNKLWYRSVPSPRAIIVPGEYSAGGTILLASKRCNAIYELKKKKSNEEIVKAYDSISSPRYMAYHSNTKMLCVLVTNESYEDELAFFRFKDAEPEESNIPPDEIEMQRLTDPPVNQIPGGPKAQE